MLRRLGKLADSASSSHAVRVRRPIVTWLVGLLLLGGTAAVAGYHVIGLIPCARPISYSIGPIDPHFGITADQFALAVDEAAALWEAPAGKTLFRQVPDGGMVISAIYDYRQQAQEKMDELDLKVDEGKKSYDALLAKHKTLDALLQKQTKQYKDLEASYTQKKAAYEAAVEAAKAGEIDQQQADRLEAMRLGVNKLVDELNPLGKKLHQTTEQFNAVVMMLNKLGGETNTAIDNYNTVGSTLHDEYDAGLYTRDFYREKIEIFAFQDTADLRRLLTHEMGHALGMEHVSDSGSVMYRLNRSQNGALSEFDVEALREKCGL